ncbi:hypothetical protein HanRHA438_Chr06g0252101 [Helianthus annuus]|nr:hypothetical protein HanRHA438_Chr06g0252101 [Helianthus annuus]
MNKKIRLCSSICLVRVKQTNTNKPRSVLLQGYHLTINDSFGGTIVNDIML